MKLLDSSAVSYQIVLAKADKVRGGGLAALVTKTTATIKTHPAAYPEVIVTSSEKGTGLPDLKATINKILES